MSARALKSPSRVAAERRAERGRIAVLKAYGTAPTTTGHDVHPVAPARGRVTDWMPRGVVPDGKGDWRIEEQGYRGRRALRRLDSLDRIAGLSPGQIEAGRLYAALTEKVASGGVKCSTAAIMGEGSGDGPGFMEAYIEDVKRLRRLQAAIGPGFAMEGRREREGSARRPIRARVLVDMICLGGAAPGQVLRRHAWAENATTRKALREALAEVLERVRGG